jgi:hypothetical protein
MKASSIRKFWESANVVSQNLFPGRVRIGGVTNGTVIGPTGVSLGGLSVEERLMPGGVDRKRGGTVRIAKTSWPDDLDLPVESSILSIQESDTEIVADWDAVEWSDYTVKQVRGYQATEPAWIIDCREK